MTQNENPPDKTVVVANGASKRTHRGASSGAHAPTESFRRAPHSPRQHPEGLPILKRMRFSPF
ncbi:hypothetical protein [Sinorhizobium medicae]|uniref:hypothetical protein n=1 Tax=Sinorhizobium medicae TaxID=110321 RepID=UPI0011B45095|nr:hypothetical protein [Sinorhizobium medicae]